jgi:hypothetical protein
MDLIQAVSLLWLTACSVSGPVVEAQTTNEDGTLVRWIDDPPNGCAVGSSGPTLNPRRSILNARLSAIEALAADSLAIDVQTVSGVGPDGSFEVSAQALSGTLADARVVALWADVDRSQQSRRRVQQVFALACWPDASTRDLPDVDYPQWLLEPPVETGRICAAGIAGPTWRPLDQPVSALRDARLALAAAIESRVEKRIFDDGHGVAKVARQIDPSRYALERAATAEELEMEWFDESGTGPIGLPGVLYGLACIDE